jgi:hypothetical protein
VYLGLSRTRRARFHRLAADALEARYGVDDGPQLAAIAMHLLEGATGGTSQRAVDVGSRAAAAAAEQQDYEQAVTMYTKALQLVPPEEPDLKRKLTVRRAVAFQRLNHLFIDVPAAAS